MLTNFVGDIKQQMFYQFRKFKLDTLIINHFIIENFFLWYGHPAQSPMSSVTFHNVIVFQCYSLYFNTTLARYTEVKYQLKLSFYMNSSLTNS